MPDTPLTDQDLTSGLSDQLDELMNMVYSFAVRTLADFVEVQEAHHAAEAALVAAHGRPDDWAERFGGTSMFDSAGWMHRVADALDPDGLGQEARGLLAEVRRHFDHQPVGSSTAVERLQQARIDELEGALFEERQYGRKVEEEYGRMANAMTGIGAMVQHARPGQDAPSEECAGCAERDREIQRLHDEAEMVHTDLAEVREALDLIRVTASMDGMSR